MRTIEDMIATRNAPIAPGCASRGKPLAEMRSHGCLFPVREEGGRTYFCAVEVRAGEWLPGMQHGSYCRFHREYLRGCVPAEEDAA